MNSTRAENIDRACAYGDGVFETIAIRDGRPRFIEAHLDRLQTGCERLGIVSPDAAELTSLLEENLHDSNSRHANATARLVAAAADSPRGYRRSKGGSTKVTLEIFPANRLPQALFVDGVFTRMCKLRLASQPALAGIKSLNRLEQVLARAEWSDPDLFEGLLLDADERLICGTMSNVFVVLNSAVVTPAITRCGVSGVMRAQVLEWLQAAGTNCDIRDIHAAELAAADECFLTNSQFGVLPVRRCEQREWAIGPVSRQAQALAAAHGVRECAP
jgi:4-amino-4-deoxychorismate lyase